MNCLDYRRALLAGERENEAMRLHRATCALCSASFSEHTEFENELRRALEVPLPAALQERLLDATPGNDRAVPAVHTGRRRFVAAAVAASVGVAATATGLYLWIVRNDPLAMACIDFVMKDEAKSIMMGAMPRAEAARVLADSLPLERLSRLGQVKHIAPCPFNGGTAYHVILMVPQEKVTLLIMPDSRLPTAARAVHDGLYAAVVPLRKGSVGIVGANRAVVESIKGAVVG
jgi:Protein of unknown function (DUF3379)